MMRVQFSSAALNLRRQGFALLTFALAVALLVGCGGSGEDGQTGADGSAGESAAAGSVDWPFFGRVPQRTHYLPEQARRPLDPPLKEAWSINTHALIEFPPAIANGVAYVVNKYGNPAAIRLGDRKVIWRRTTKGNLHGAPLTVTGPAYHDGRVYYAGLGGYLVSVDAADGHVIWLKDLHAHLESSPLVIGNTLYIGTDTAKLLAVDIADGSVRWTFDAPGAIKSSPSYDDGRIFLADYQGSVYALDAKSGKPVWRTNTTRVPPFGQGGFFSSPRSPSARSTPPVTTAPSSASTRRPARFPGPSRPALSSTGRRPRRRSPARRRASISAPKTAASMRSTPPTASRAGTTTSAARCRARRP